MNPVVLVGHQHNCPLHEVNQVESGSAAYTFNGKPVARVGDRTTYEPVRLELLAASFKQVEHGPWWPINSWLFLSSGGRLAHLKAEAQWCRLIDPPR
ncbi:MAG: PAAR domain-containing protein [Candidatus Pseudomonas phytovorans]|uniref:PAAR domain-containing protein n=1 Tax=Candidatus Pseudomonas phytovorans TaxID=3121377 RepID=A0AAJ5WE06_9PSED|nr:PAAR domain-containing protein [Pseudomonas sp.]WEK28718.1 MAG: PAAR domain-containing protein [Pseudomonas sp.]